MARASLVAQMMKHLPAMQETQIPSLGQEDPLETETAPHSSMDKMPGWLQSVGSLRVGHD